MKSEKQVPDILKGCVCGHAECGAYCRDLLDEKSKSQIFPRGVYMYVAALGGGGGGYK